ncbi:MAG: glycoside hydrolase [Dysgonamonadaceae bacterium]|nr:glycoside hydrolase [Dysgonamonadaceae bacterium]
MNYKSLIINCQLIVALTLAFCGKAVADTHLISRIDVLDAWEYNYNASHWLEQGNLQNGAQMYGERDDIFITSLSDELVGADWIQTAFGSKHYDRHYVICYFKLKADAEIFIIHNDEIIVKPLWLRQDYREVDGKVTNSNGDTFSVFRREAKAGDLIELGQNVNIKEEGSKEPNMYIVAVKPLQPIVREMPTGKVFDVREFGAVGDGKTMNTNAIQAAIDKSNASGGGTVYIADGIYMTGTLVLKDNVTLWVDAGSILRGSQDANDYPAIRVSLPSFRQKEDFQLIFAEKKKNITITGGGIIDGNAIAYGRPWGGTNNEWQRPRLIRMFECENITVKNITLVRAANWVQYYEACSDMLFETVQIRAYTGVHNLDGLNLSGCRNVIVRDFTATTGDDSIVIKAMSMVPNENIYVDGLFSRYSNCHLFKIGTETHSAVRNLHLKNARGWARYSVSVQAVDGAVVEDILIENVELYSCSSPFFIRLGSRGRTFEGGPNPAPIAQMRNITLRNISNTGIRFVPDKAGPGVGALATGIAGHRIENLTIENGDFLLYGTRLSKDAIYREIPQNADRYPEFHTLGILPAYGIFFRHIDGLTVRNVRLRLLNEDIRPAIILDDVINYTLEGITYDLHPNSEPFPIWHMQDGEIKVEPWYQHPPRPWPWR